MRDPDEQLSKNFKRSEFVCRCGCGFGLGPEDIDPELVKGLQALRDAYGAPITLTCGCRCQAHNDSLPGSVPNSQHVKGKAADITGHDVVRLWHLAQETGPFVKGGVIYYPRKGFVHVDVRRGKYREVNRRR